MTEKLGNPLGKLFQDAADAVDRKALEIITGKPAEPEPVKIPDGGLKVNDDVVAVVRIDARRNGTTRVIKPGALGRVKGWSLKGWWVTFIFNGGRQMDVLVSSDQIRKISSEYGGKIF